VTAVRLALLFLLFLVSAVPACGQRPKLPQTQPAQRLERLLNAFNGGTADEIRFFIADNYSEAALKQRSAEERTRTYLELHRNTHGFILRSIDGSTAAEIIAVVQTQLTGEWYRISCSVEPQKPYKITGVLFSQIPTPPKFAAKGKLSDENIAQQAHGYAERLVKAGMFSGVVLVARGSRPILAQAYGNAARSRATVDTPFPLASITKTFTAVVIGQLVDQGKLSFHNPIGKFFPSYPGEAREKITLHHLLTHSAGLPGFLDPKEQADFRRLGLRTVAQWVSYIGSKPLAFAPGQGFQYSNAGYILLDAVISVVAGNPAEYRAQHLFHPLGMNQTTSNDSTANDLLRFSVGLRSGKLLSPGTLSLMTSPRVTTNDPSVRYGYGLEIEDINGVRVIGHPGGGAGASAQLDMYPDLDITVVVLSTMPRGAAQHISNKLRDLITQR